MTSAVPGPDSLPPAGHHLLVGRQVDGHLRGAAVAGLASAAGALVTVWALGTVVRRSWAVAWLLLLVLVLGVRWFRARALRQAPPVAAQMPTVLSQLRLFTCLHGLVWGGLPLLLPWPWPMAQLDLLVPAIAGAAVAGAAVCLMYDSRAALAFVLPTILPLGLGLSQLQGPLPRAVTVALIVMGVLLCTLLAAARAVHRDMQTLAVEKQADAVQSQRSQQAEALLRKVFDHVGEGLCLFDERQRLVAWNARMVSLMGVDPSLVRVGTPLRDLMVEMGRRGEFGDVDPLQEADRRLAAMARPGSGLTQRTRPDGSVVEIRRSPLPDGGFTLLAVDITERRASEQASARNRNTLTLLLESTEEGVWFIDNDQRTTDANPAMCRMLGLTREQMLGRSIFDFVDAENDRIFRDQVRRRSQGLPGSYEVALLRSDGQLVHCQNNPTPLIDDRGVKVGAVGLFSDISAHKRAAAELQRTGELLAAKTRVLESTLQSLSQGVLGIDNQGRIEIWNQRALDLLQAPPDLLVPGLDLRRLVAWQLEKGYFDACDDERAQRSLTQVRRFVRGDDAAAKAGTYRRRRPDGRIIEVHIDETPDGAQVRTYSDVTESAHAQAALRASESRFRSMADAAPAFIWQGDAQGRALWFNQAWLRRLGRSLEQAVAEPWLERIRADDYDRIQQAFVAASSGQQPFEVEFRVRTADGSELWIADHGIPMRDADGGLDGFLVYGWDVTGRKAAERSLIAARDEADRASRAKSEFLSRMSHELRTPLNAVLGFAQLIEREPAEPLFPLQRERVHQILRGGGHLLDLINEVLDLARIEAGAPTMQVEELAVGAMLRECLRLVEPAAQQAGVRLELGPLAADLGSVHTDATRLRQVLLNLLSNAIKYNRPGGLVRLLASAGPDAVRLEVCDTGPGLTAQQQERLFQAFDRLGAEHGTVEGTGIGLALSKALVDLMGGRIGVHSVVGQGSSFWVEMPRGQAAAASTVAARPPSTALAPALGAPAEGPRRRVLYIEDNRVNQIVVESMLARLPQVEVALASDPAEGLGMAFAQPPDLVLLDIQLPAMSGYEVLARLRGHPATAAVPAIAVTANAMPEDLARARDAGFDDYVTKPLQLDRLLAAVSARLPPAKAQSLEGEG